MKAEYCNGVDIAVNASEKEVTIAFLHDYIIFSKFGGEDEFERLETAKVVMSSQNAEKLFRSLGACLSSYDEYQAKSNT